MSRMSCSYYFFSFRDGRQEAIHLLSRGVCLQDLFNMARSILEQFPLSFFAIRFVSVHVVHPYSSVDTIAALKKLRCNLSEGSDFHMIHAFARHVLKSISLDEMLLPRYVNQIQRTDIKRGDVFFLIKTYVLHFVRIHVEANASAGCSKLCSRDSAWVDVFARSAMSSA